MPSCAIVTCKSRSQVKCVSRDRISYHRFPHDPDTKEKWINVTGRRHKWFPTKTSTICSKHFKEDDFLQKNSNFRYLKDEAVPSKEIVVIQTREEPKYSKSKSKRSESKSNTCVKFETAWVEVEIKTRKHDLETSPPSPLEEKPNIATLQAVTQCSVTEVKIKEEPHENITEQHLNVTATGNEEPVAKKQRIFPSESQLHLEEPNTSVVKSETSISEDASNAETTLKTHTEMEMERKMQAMDTSDSESDTSAAAPPTNLKKMLEWKDIVIKKKTAKIKRLQAQNRRLRKKLTKMEQDLQALKGNFSMQRDN